MTKKVYKQAKFINSYKQFTNSLQTVYKLCSVVTKNPNWEMFSKNLVTFKR